MPQTGDFPIESQAGRAVGIQEDMARKPEPATMQEGDDSFDHYKAAGKMVGKKTIVTGGDSGEPLTLGHHPDGQASVVRQR